MHNIGWGYAIVSTIVLVLLIIAAIVRKTRNATQMKKNKVEVMSEEDDIDIPVVELTPKSASTDFASAQTPKAAHV
ncbi:hypothetical protein P43SY_010730 [Pythium insidiosum]|uniref:Uncharacterized protein n=1 Tax=Pythium insidiosum TaxID=114742 RepID=A0AAD5M103_PYTIN|nr:hypothetical protein P43SY_010730 [Pythium insidiosum]